MILWIFACQPSEMTSCDTLLCAVEPEINEVTFRLRKVPYGTDPLRRYDLDTSMYVLVHEVTQRQFETVMKTPAHSDIEPLSSIGPSFPAAYVSWNQAAMFANALTVLFNESYDTEWQECYDCSNDQCSTTISPYACSGFRLPTEAEWEYLARSGSTKDFWTGSGPYQGGSTEDRLCTSDLMIYDESEYPLLQDYAWYCYTSNSKRVGQKRPNGFGMYDIQGNVWEWTADVAGCEYPNTDLNPFCTGDSDDSIVRGGAWSTFPYYLAASNRSIANRERRDSSIGFRILRSDI